MAERGLTAVAAERVVRIALGQLPVTLVGRATTYLRRFFSDGSWSSNDDAALAAAVGPGKNWYEDHLDADLVMEFGWRGGAFKVEVRYTPDDSQSELGDAHATDTGAHGRTLGDTFEDAIVLDAGRTPNELRFGIGPVPGNATFTRDNNDRDPRVAVLFRECPDLEQVSIGAGMLSATIADATRWSDVLLALVDAIIAGFVQSRPAPPDRQLERAQRELGALSPDSSRDLARILDATTSPDASFRRIAIERLVGTDAVIGRAPWRRGLADSSRAVRRTTAACSRSPPRRRPATCSRKPSPTTTRACGTTASAAWPGSASRPASRPWPRSGTTPTCASGWPPTRWPTAGCRADRRPDAGLTERRMPG